MKSYLLVLITILTLSGNSFATKLETIDDNSNKLAVLWTSGDPEVAEKVCFMYTNNAKKQGWFDEVVLIVWGPSAKLLTENKMLQDYIKTMQQSGVKIEACYYCADMYGVVDKLKAMDIDVKGMGIPLSNYLKEGWHTLTF
ncbi:DsrE family protein [uncultured Sunxiuqinia sp.]|uniref:DsrE family protein n=1 Tax=uncultured Sunxiuqinia sp. TaxID=1573825 RepID=UPI0026054952|nr:DsrE family protein [uncultured Sunxiuqinia sp.]